MMPGSGCKITPRRRSNYQDRKGFVANGLDYAHQGDLMFTKHLADQKYDTAMVCIDAFSKYAVVVLIKRY